MYFQLHTIRCQVGVSFPSFIYFLLPNTAVETYCGMIEILKIIRRFVAPQNVFVGFEQAGMSALT